MSRNRVPPLGKRRGNRPLLQLQMILYVGFLRSLVYLNMTFCNSLAQLVVGLICG